MRGIAFRRFPACPENSMEQLHAALGIMSLDIGDSEDDEYEADGDADGRDEESDEDSNDDF